MNKTRERQALQHKHQHIEEGQDRNVWLIHKDLACLHDIDKNA